MMVNGKVQAIFDAVQGLAHLLQDHLVPAREFHCPGAALQILRFQPSTGDILCLEMVTPWERDNLVVLQAVIHAPGSSQPSSIDSVTKIQRLWNQRQKQSTRKRLLRTTPKSTE